MKALLVIDMQKEGVYESYNNERNSKLYNRSVVIKNIKQLIRKFNSTRNLVIQLKVWITDPDKTSMTKVYPNEGIANTKGAQIIDELKDEHYDYVVKKMNYSGFWKTDLDKILKKHKVKQIYLTGMNTGFCVFCTGLDAYYRGYDVFLVEDAASTVSGKRVHEQGIQQFRDFFGEKIIKTRNLI
jgi:nicotinamidase-related amidase